MRRVTLRLDIDRETRTSSIIEEVTELLRQAPRSTADYLRVIEIESGDLRAIAPGGHHYGPPTPETLPRDVALVDAYPGDNDPHA